MRNKYIRVEKGEKVEHTAQVCTDGKTWHRVPRNYIGRPFNGDFLWPVRRPMTDQEREAEKGAKAKERAPLVRPPEQMVAALAPHKTWFGRIIDRLRNGKEVVA